MPLRERLAQLRPAELLDVVVELDGTRELVEGLADWLGITGERGVRFPDVLPRRERSRLRAQWWLDPRGLHVYNLGDPDAASRRSYALAQVYASVVAGRVIAPRKTVLLKWKLRLLHAVGLYEIPMASPPELLAPDDDVERVFAAGLASLFSIQLAFNPGGVESALARGFLADWCGFSRMDFAIQDQPAEKDLDNRVRDRARALIERYAAVGRIRKVGTAPNNSRHATQLWAPGPRWR